MQGPGDLEVSINYFADFVSVCSSQILSRYIKNSFSVKKYMSNVGIANYYLSYAKNFGEITTFWLKQRLCSAHLECSRSFNETRSQDGTLLTCMRMSMPKEGSRQVMEFFRCSNSRDKNYVFISCGKCETHSAWF
jgi:hypothetical protein